MTRYPEVEYVGSYRPQTAVGPHSGRNVRFVRRPSRTQHLVNPLGLESVPGRWDLWGEEKHDFRLVRGDHGSRADVVGVVLVERLQYICRAGQNVQECRAVRHPAAPGEPILLPINRLMVSVFRHDDLGSDARVITISLN